MGIRRIFLLAAVVLFVIAGLGAIRTFSGINTPGLTCFGLACGAVAGVRPIRIPH